MDGKIVPTAIPVRIVPMLDCVYYLNAVIGFQATAGSFAHADCSGIVMKNAHVQDMSVVRSAEVIYGSDNE